MLLTLLILRCGGQRRGRNHPHRVTAAVAAWEMPSGRPSGGGLERADEDDDAAQLVARGVRGVRGSVATRPPRRLGAAPRANAAAGVPTDLPGGGEGRTYSNCLHVSDRSCGIPLCAAMLFTLGALPHQRPMASHFQAQKDQHQHAQKRERRYPYTCVPVFHEYICSKTNHTLRLRL